MKEQEICSGESEERGNPEKTAEIIDTAEAPETSETADKIEASETAGQPMQTISRSRYILRKLSIFSTVITSVIILSALIILILFILGINPYIVSTGSMEPNIHVGSICFVNGNVAFDSIDKGDVITFMAGDETIVTHRVKEVTYEGLITKGDANNTQDISPVTEKNYIGRVMISIPKIGYILFFLRRKTGRILCITAILTLLLFSLMPEETT